MKSEEETFDIFVCVCKHPGMYAANIVALEATLRTMVWIGMRDKTITSWDRYVRTVGWPNDLNKWSMNDFGETVLENWFYPMVISIHGIEAKEKYGPKKLDTNFIKDKDGHVLY